MKRVNKIFSYLLVITMITTGCEAVLDTDSDVMLSPDNYQLNTPNDSLYSMIGIFTQLQELADNYVLLGELRADLMNITPDTRESLQEIYNHEITEDNPYNKIEDYYEVINNCNYVINNVDTSIILKREKVMYKQYAAAKAIRAWTYLQMALNYGSVKYYEQAILNVSDADDFEIMTLNELLPALIQDLEPWTTIDKPGGISLGADIANNESSFFSIRFLLGDLYLWNGQYENAAIQYYNLMDEEELVISSDLRSLWEVDRGEFIDTEFPHWLELLFLEGEGQITKIVSSTENTKGSFLDSLSQTYGEIMPSELALNNWDKQLYYHDATTFIEGDLRGDVGSYLSAGWRWYITINGVEYDTGDATNFDKIIKYRFMSRETAQGVSIYRSDLLYLRYAEAVNRAGKPNLAFATIKNGLKSTTMRIDSIVPPSEKYASFTEEGGTFYDYIDFEDAIFDENIGVHALGCGNVNLSRDFIIPELSSAKDSIEWVEDKIIEELALETAFEGHRFHDLMRISMRRSDPAYLAKKVSDKYVDNKEVIQSKLMDENNWYLP